MNCCSAEMNDRSSELFFRESTVKEVLSHNKQAAQIYLSGLFYIVIDKCANTLCLCIVNVYCAFIMCNNILTIMFHLYFTKNSHSPFRTNSKGAVWRFKRSSPKLLPLKKLLTKATSSLRIDVRDFRKNILLSELTITDYIISIHRNQVFIIRISAEKSLIRPKKK